MFNLTWFHLLIIPCQAEAITVYKCRYCHRRATWGVLGSTSGAGCRQKESISAFLERRKFLGILEDLTMLWIVVNNDNLVSILFVMRDQPRNHLGDDWGSKRIIEIANEIRLRQLK